MTRNVNKLLRELLRLTVLVATVTAQVTMEECKNTHLPNLLACLDSDTSPCDPLPIPEQAFPVDTPNELGYALLPLRMTPNTLVFALTDNSNNGLVIVDSATPAQDEVAISIAMVDFSESMYQRGPDMSPTGHHALSAIDDILDMLDATVNDIVQVDMIYSHGHKDHIGAALFVYDGLMDMGIETINVVASVGLRDLLDKTFASGFSTYRVPLPNVVFDKKAEHAIGASTSVSLHPVSAHQHSERDLIVFMDATADDPAIMMMVDVVFPKWSPIHAFSITTDLLAYIQVHDIMLSYDLGEDGYFLGGHFTVALGGRVDIELSKELTLAIVKNADTALKTVNPAVGAASGAFDPMSPNFGNGWLVGSVWFDAIARQCARQTLEEYGCTFAGLDVWVHSCCDLAQYFVRVDMGGFDPSTAVDVSVAMTTDSNDDESDDPEAETNGSGGRQRYTNQLVGATGAVLIATIFSHLI